MRKIYYLFLAIQVCLAGCKKQGDLIVATNQKTTLTETAVVKLPSELINEGISGNTTKDLLNRISTVTKQKPNLVIVMAGINDVYQGSVTFSNYEKNLNSIVDSLKASGSAVMLLTPTYVDPSSMYIKNMGMLDSACAIVKAVSVQKSCYFGQLKTDMKLYLDAHPDQMIYHSDGLHPNRIGYELIGNLVYGYYKKAQLYKVKIVCFGDSITFGAGVAGGGTATGESYPAILKKLINSNL